jgi:hypothetical protein
MKHGKRPTVKQKKFIAEKGFNPDNWLIIKDCQSELLIQNRISEKLKSYDKVAGCWRNGVCK